MEKIIFERDCAKNEDVFLRSGEKYTVKAELNEYDESARHSLYFTG